ncbi:T9SS type A sorting domain-containing protein [Flavobacterium sp.]|uniref:T9SS type A sorting domain-containing protein n=2 Tax=Flavobacterium sp. TaxID=239 RepID=UPI003750651A
MSNISKRKFTLLTLLLSTFCVFSQDILWEKSYGGKQADYLMDAIPTPDYGFILAGSSLSDKSGNKSENGMGDLDYWIWKMNEKGDLDWQKSFGGSGSDFLQSIKTTSDGGFILAGTSNSSNVNTTETSRNDKKEACRGGDDFWIIKLDAKGNEMWQKTIGGMGQEKLQSIVRTSDGGYVIAGSSSSESSPNPSEGGEKGSSAQGGENESLTKTGDKELSDKTAPNYGNMDYWMVKLDSKGNIQFQKTFGGKYEDELKSIEQTKDGGYILGGYSNSPSSATSKIGTENSGNKTQDNIGVGDFWVLKLDKDGEITWQKTLGGDQDDNLYVVHQTYDGNYILGGNSNSNATNQKSKSNENGTDFWVIKLDTQGETIWQETYNIGKVDVLTSLIENDDHSVLLGGFAQSESSTQPSPMERERVDKKEINDYVAIKITERGEETWRQSVGSKGEDLLKKAIETRDGGYLLAGTSKGEKSRDKDSGIGSNDFWVVKLKDNSKPENPKLSIEALPNPVITFTNIIVGYDFTDGFASVYDLAGRQLQRFAIKTRTVPIDLSGLPEGIYIVNIDTNVQHDGIKVIKGINRN